MLFSDLPEYLPLKRAAKEYHITADVLQRAVDDGIIAAVLVDGQVMVFDVDVAIVAAQVLEGSEDDELVSLNEAARRLEINSSVVCKWETYGWLPVVATGSRHAKLVSWAKAKALGVLHHRQAQRGSRLIPRDKVVADTLAES